MRKIKPWFQGDKNKSSFSEDTFYKPHSFNFESSVLNNFSTIEKEVLNFLSNNNDALKPYFNSSLANQKNKWKALSFKFWQMTISRKLIKKCPETANVFNSIPYVLSYSISVMEAQSEIQPHYGDTDAIIRCHLGIEIPDGLPNCGIRVGYEDKPWKKGEILIFNDAAYHKTWNHTNQRRVVLIFDILRPEFIDNKNKICFKIWRRMGLQFLKEKFTRKK